MSSGDPKNTPLGEKIIVAGLFFQIVLFGFFVIVSFIFHRRINKNPTTTSLELEKLPMRQNWRYLLYTLYVSSALILIRSLFRAIEFIEGNDGYLMRSEGWLYGFDSVLMWIAVIIFNMWHPSGCIPGNVKQLVGWGSEETMSLDSRCQVESRDTNASSV